MVHVAERIPDGYEQISVAAHSLNEILLALTRLAEGIAGWMDAHGEPGGAALRERGTQVVADLRARLRRVEELVAGRAQRRAVCLEWLDPFYCAGHWLPEMVERAGGWDPLGRPGRDSLRVDWSQVVAAQPEVLLALPCSLTLEQAAAELQRLSDLPGTASIPAVQAGQVWALWAERYFSGSSPRIVDGIEVLAALLHPETASQLLPAGAAREVDLGTAAPSTS